MVLLIVSIALHLIVAAWLLQLFILPPPASTPPQLIVDSIELTLAEIESDVVSESVPLATAPVATAPVAEIAPYLTAPDSPIVLPETPPLQMPAPSLSDLPPPTFPLPTLTHEPTDLPEITLPPIEIPADPTPSKPPQQATGATARLEHPELLTDLATLQKSYPEEARRNHWEGVVTLRIRINAQGRAEAIEILESSGYRVLDREAQKMLRRARFRGGPGELIQKIAYSLKK